MIGRWSLDKQSSKVNQVQLQNKSEEIKERSTAEFEFGPFPKKVVDPLSKIKSDASISSSN